MADELVAEFTDPNNNIEPPDPDNPNAVKKYDCLLHQLVVLYRVCAHCVKMQQQYDEKNIRRRVYDALNVLMAMDIISKDKKEIQWKGLPRTSINDIEELQVASIFPQWLLTLDVPSVVLLFINLCLFTGGACRSERKD